MAKGHKDKDILIAEVGAQSKGNGVVYRVPYNWKIKAPLDHYEQVKAYEGILGAFMGRPWCRGVMLWNWEVDPDAGKDAPTNLWYTPQNKPALAVMKKYFKKNYSRKN